MYRSASLTGALDMAELHGAGACGRSNVESAASSLCCALHVVPLLLSLQLDVMLWVSLILSALWSLQESELLHKLDVQHQQSGPSLSPASSSSSGVSCPPPPPPPKSTPTLLALLL